MKDQELVAVMVPRNRLTEVYALLGTEPPVEPMADPAVIEKAYEESSPGMKAFLDLLSGRPDEWLSIEEIRDQLGMKTHQLPGVLSTFPRRWRGRYRQSGPMPFDVVGKASQRRYRMGMETAELIRAQD